MSEKLKVEISDFDHPSEGYIVIAPFSEESKAKIYEIQTRFAKKFGEHNLWLPKNDQLHITFCHIITPNAVYEEEKGALFDRLRPIASRALLDVVPSPLSLVSKFESVEAFPSSVILKAKDQGDFDTLRKKFTDKFALPKETRKPPEIIHTTIVRFRNPIDFEEVENLTAEIMEGFVPFHESIDALQLIREKRIFVQDHDVIESYPPQT